MTSQRLYDPGIAASVAHLPEPPDDWSYSTLKEIESCPRRYVLGHAAYPDLWSGRGYPQQPHPAALFGDIVHDSLERIVKALSAAGCISSNSAEAADVLREMGGYSAIARKALDERLARLETNPRLDGERRARLRQYLEDRLPEARIEIQGYLQRMRLVRRVGRASLGGGSEQRPRGPLGVGSHPEADLCVDRLRVKGRIDLLTVMPERVDITDHKTGAKDPSHLDQLRFYAMLWDQDEVANQLRTSLGTLTASYPTEDVTVPAPDAAELADLVTQTVGRVAAADKQFGVEEPIATPGEPCRYCSVRSLCTAYWRTGAPNPAELRGGTWFDYEGIVGEQNGIKSWWMVDDHGRKEILLRTPPRRPLVSGQRLRILGLRRDDDPEVGAPVATMTTNAEVFVVQE